MSGEAGGAPGLPAIREAAALLRDVAQRTPLLGSRSLSERLATPCLLKAEHLQRTGSFKVRGAYVRISRLSEAERRRGVVAASAGNHAQGVGWAARALGVPATIVMPVQASLSKVEATKAYGAAIEQAGETVEESLEHARALAAERDLVLVHPFDDPWVIAGQGTVGLEVCEDAPEARRVVVPVGGGGLIAGIAIAVKSLRPEVTVVGVRAAATPTTIADGAAVSHLGPHCAELVEDFVDEVVEVDEESISEAIVLLLERTKQVVEGAGALPLAALLSGNLPPGEQTVLLLSGGNIDPGLLMRVIRHGLGEAGRYLFVRVMLEDRPGQLLGVLQLLAELLVNVLSVVHHRAGPLPVGAVEVELTLETRDREHAAQVVAALREAGYEPLT